MATLAARISDLAGAVRDKINAMMPRLLPAGGALGQVLTKNSATAYDAGWATPAAGGGGVVRTVRRLTAAHANSTVTPTTVTDGTTPWTHNMVAGKVYRLTVTGGYQTVALTTGAKLQLLGAGGILGTLHGSAWGAIVAATSATGLEASLYNFAGNPGSFVLTTAVNPINTAHNIGLEAVFHCLGNGTMSVQFASEVAASAAQLNTSSCFIVEELA